MVCPHAVIRSKVYVPSVLEGAPTTFKSRDARLPDWKGLKYTLQVAVEDCTGCGICVDVCPARNKSEARLKAINMRRSRRCADRAENWSFFLSIPELDRRRVSLEHIRAQQVQQPLFEFSGACAGCGETPYLKLLSQLFGDRLIVANATGCSSIYGETCRRLLGRRTPTVAARRGATRFSDNAEFGLGFRVSLDKQREFAAELLGLAPEVGEQLANEILHAEQRTRRTSSTSASECVS